MLNEFEIIERFFMREPKRKDVVLGVGDDCALLKVPSDQLLAVSIDTLNENIHFLPTIPAHALGYKALAVNLSDLAAMGATPAWITCALTLPEVNEFWLSEFARGLFELSDRYHMDLVGGNISKGPLSVSIQVHGFAPPQSALTRSYAKAGDLIFVSGPLGAAGAAVLAHTGKLQVSDDTLKILNQAWYYPEPQIELGVNLRAKATSAIDISDGLTADLGHILKKSNVGAIIHAEQIPIHPLLTQILPMNKARQLALRAGEDYQLCFTLPKNEANFWLNNPSMTCIGEIVVGNGLQIVGDSNEKLTSAQPGFRHF